MGHGPVHVARLHPRARGPADSRTLPSVFSLGSATQCALFVCWSRGACDTRIFFIGESCQKSKRSREAAFRCGPNGRISSELVPTRRLLVNRRILGSVRTEEGLELGHYPYTGARKRVLMIGLF